ncbi:DUF1326 domain-containing protein [Rubrimonas sp.]|uniref:DUF1326 domain-containing protein n=1 Tax=Rubrimonas sp. TaxID=2036015 RepID=UPI002FDEE129
MTPWEIRGLGLTNCNCNFGCPCQFGVLPSRGNCEAAIVFDIERGHHGDTDLSGLRAAAIYHWPGAIHEGDGQMQLVIDTGASDAQAAALERIMTGQDTEEMKTMWFVYAKMSPNRYPTLRKRIDVTHDIGARTGRARIDGVADIELKPVPNIVTGEPHRAILKLPHGFEFHEAEVASGRTTLTGGEVSFAPLVDTHAHFARLHLSHVGVIDGAA